MGLVEISMSRETLRNAPEKTCGPTGEKSKLDTAGFDTDLQANSLTSAREIRMERASPTEDRSYALFAVSTDRFIDYGEEAEYTWRNHAGPATSRGLGFFGNG
ncbi:MAG: hypothetical protein AMXMBFR82_38830 [Candidatus Hydrogenedentota bacterium]